MAAVKAPFNNQAGISRTFSPVPDSPWPNSAMTPSNSAAHNNMYVDAFTAYAYGLLLTV